VLHVPRGTRNSSRVHVCTVTTDSNICSKYVALTQGTAAAQSTGMFVRVAWRHPGKKTTDDSTHSTHSSIIEKEW
jgi:hypothetical protein